MEEIGYILVIFVTIFVGILKYFKWSYTYWRKRNLPYLEPSFPFGTMENPFARTTSLAFWIKNSYDQLKSQGHKHGGIYNFAQPLYLPVDPEYVKNIMQRDFQHFVDRGFYYNEKDEPISAHLFAVGGKKWRNLRTKLTPTFTSGKMKMMFETLLQCCGPMKNAMDQCVRNKQEVDIRDIVSCFTVDVIGSCAFGLDCNSFKTPDAEFVKFGRKIFYRNKFKAFLNMAIFLSKPELGRFLGIRFYLKEVTDFFMKAVKDMVNFRETNNITRKDMLQILINLKSDENDNSADQHDISLTFEEIAAQVFAFFVAGFETSSTTMTYCLFELALNQEIQRKVRDEISQVLLKHSGQITYESLMDMDYMTQVVEETLRKYPPAPLITRKCVKDYKVPDADVVIEKGTIVFISSLGLHRDSEFFPDPETFDPERFSRENRKQIKPFTYIPFGEGPRICIGQRFGIMQVKVGLTVLLKSYEFSLNRKTKVPLEIDTCRNLFATKGTIWLNTRKVEQS